MKILIVLLLMTFFSCVRSDETLQDDDDYVLIEFAAKLEEEQDQFNKLEETKKSTVP